MCSLLTHLKPLKNNSNERENNVLDKNVIELMEKHSHALTKALMRAQEAGLHLRVTYNDGAYSVPSTTHTDENYLVRLHPDGIQCECAGAQYGRLCKHMAAVLLCLYNENRLDAYLGKYALYNNVPWRVKNVRSYARKGS